MSEKLTKLPEPKIIVFCRKCDDVTPVLGDRHGYYCSKCFRAIEGKPL